MPSHLKKSEIVDRNLLVQENHGSVQHLIIKHQISFIVVSSVLLKLICSLNEDIVKE